MLLSAHQVAAVTRASTRALLHAPSIMRAPYPSKRQRLPLLCQFLPFPSSLASISLTLYVLVTVCARAFDCPWIRSAKCVAFRVFTVWFGCQPSLTCRHGADWLCALSVRPSSLSSRLVVLLLGLPYSCLTCVFLHCHPQPRQPLPIPEAVLRDSLPPALGDP